MSIYNINFDQKAAELLPPDKRYKFNLNWVRSLLSQNQYNHTDVFIDYKTGSDYPYWDYIGPYSIGDRVIYNQSVYESLIDSNTLVPTDPPGWKLYQQYFVGVDERLTYRGENLILTYALNKRFNTTFKQPPLQSDIYIENNQIGTLPFVVGGSEFSSSVVYYDFSYDYIINDYTPSTVTNFTIFVPEGVYNALSTDPASRDKIIREFVDKYVNVGMTYNITTYI